MNVIRLQNGQEVVPLRGDMARYLAHPENLSPGDVVPFMARVRAEYRNVWNRAACSYGVTGETGFAREYWRDYPEYEAFGLWILMACRGLFWMDSHGSVMVRFREHFARAAAAYVAPCSPVLPQVELRIRDVSPEQAGSYVLGPGFQVVVSDTARRGYRTMRLA